MKEPVGYFLSMLFSVFVFVAIIAFTKWRELTKERELRNLVSWSTVRSRPNELLIHAHDLPLWSYISNSQIELKLPQDYRIGGDDEWAYTKEILEEYQKDLTQSYFKGHLIVIKSKYVISGENYFMASLYAFLSEHQCDYKFIGHDMHKERISYKRYGEGFSSAYDVIYALTDFAIVFHKMHYITYMYCRRNDILRSLVPEWNEKNLKEILDTKQIQLSRY
jgi:hypothetical protein